jgi:hypothetical protein
MLRSSTQLAFGGFDGNYSGLQTFLLDTILGHQVQFGNREEALDRAVTWEFPDGSMETANRSLWLDELVRCKRMVEHGATEDKGREEA